MGVNPEVVPLELILEHPRRRLAFKPGDDDAADVDPPIGQVIDQFERIDVIGDSEIRPDFLPFDITGEDAEEEIGLVLELLEKSHFHIRVEPGQDPGRVIVEEDFPAELKVEFIIELPDPVPDGRRLFFQIALAVEPDLFGHTFLLSDLKTSNQVAPRHPGLAKILIPQQKKHVNPRKFQRRFLVFIEFSLVKLDRWDKRRLIMRERHILSIAAAVIVWLPGYLSAQPAEWKGRIITENDVRVVVNPEKPLFGEITMTLKEELTIGNELDDRQYFYGDIGVAIDREGRIFILDGEQNRIQIFDHDGKFIRSFGRKGQGPGEFQSPAGICIIDGSSICTIDNSRLLIFGLEGNLKNSISLRPRGSAPFAVGEQGEILAVSRARTSKKNLVYKVSLFDPKGNRIKDFIESPFEEIRFPGNKIIRIKDEQANPCLAPWMPGIGIFGLMKRYELSFIGEEGQIAFIVRREGEPIPYTDQERQRNLEAQKRIQEKIPGSARLSASELKQAYDLPKHRPYFISLLSDDGGRVYALMDPEPGFKKGFEYDLFDREGYYLYRIHLPPRVIPECIAGGRLYSSWFDKSGLRYIKRYRITNWEEISPAAFKKGPSLPRQS